MRASMAFLVVTASVMLSCGDIGEPVVPPVSLNYIPGYVEVGFADSVGYGFIRSFLDSLNLIPLHILADFRFLVVIQIDSGDVGQGIGRLVMDSAVTSLSWEVFTGTISVWFLGSVPNQYALSLIASIRGFSVKYIFRQPTSATVIVEIGQEEKWVETFKTYPFVTWAGLWYKY